MWALLENILKGILDSVCEHVLPSALATATFGGQTDLSNSPNELALHSFNPATGALEKTARAPLDGGAHAMCWTPPTHIEHGNGSIVLGHDEGAIVMYGDDLEGTVTIYKRLFSTIFVGTFYSATSFLTRFFQHIFSNTSF